MALLSIDNLTVDFHGRTRAVDGLSLEVEAGETLAIVGESGSGKSVASLSVLRLLPPSARIVSGAITFDGVNLIDKSDRDMRAVRGERIAMIFQEPMTSLNPAYTIGRQIAEPLRVHRKLKGREARAEAIELMRLVHIPEPEWRVDAYPHELSGGLRQRAMIALALACRPAVLIADEPTTALDVTIQAQILDLIRRLRRELSMAVLLITHDFGVVAELAERVVVMYAGRPVEQGRALDIFDRPRHPYTRALLAARPQLRSNGRLAEIAGRVAVARPGDRGCNFAERCPFAFDRCRAETPRLRGQGHRVACHLAEASA